MTDTTQVGDSLRIVFVDDDLLVPRGTALLAGSSGIHAKDAMNSNEELKAATEEVLS
jgi:hypothetical protein